MHKKETIIKKYIELSRKAYRAANIDEEIQATDKFWHHVENYMTGMCVSEIHKIDDENNLEIVAFL